MKVAILVRVSSKSDRQDYDRQISDLTKIAEKNKWTIVEIVTAKISATKTRLAAREDIARLFELVEEGAIEKILVTELTRLGRVAREIRSVYEYLQEQGIAIYVQSLGLDTGSKGPFQKAINNIIVTILAEISELEAVRLTDRIKSGMEEARKKGKVIGRPKGSVSDMQEKIRTIPEYKRAARALNEGLSLRKTAAFSGLSPNTVRKIKKAL